MHVVENPWLASPSKKITEDHFHIGGGRILGVGRGLRIRGGGHHPATPPSRQTSSQPPCIALEYVEGPKFMNEKQFKKGFDNELLIEI